MHFRSPISIPICRVRVAAIYGLLLAISNTLFSQSIQPRIYINSFQSGQLLAFDPGSQQIVWSTSVEDGSGIIGAAISNDGKRIFVVDGNQQNFVRVLDSATGKELAKHEFKNRLRLLYGGPVIHLTADGRWLFVKTYDDSSAASGVRIFNVAEGQFVPTGLRACDCGSPVLVSTRNGSVVAICADSIYELRMPASASTFVPRRRAEIPIRVVVGAAVSDDGSIYVIGKTDEGKKWTLSAWIKNSDHPTIHDLSKLVGAKFPEDESRASMDLSSDGTKLALIMGVHAVILEAPTLKVLHSIDLPWPVQKAAFSPDGADLYSLRSYGGGEKVGESLLLRVSVRSGEINKVPLTGVTLARSAAILLAAPAP